MTRESGSRRPTLAALVLVAWTVQAHAQDAGAASAGLTVMTKYGELAGLISNGVREFRGIPYAAPPVGDLRWELPYPAQAWRGVRDATYYRSACPQLERYGIPESSENEDCLYLNVTTPLPSGQPATARRPVIVWIHGGAFVGGSSGLYDLSEFAKAGDVVVVSMNYRLGVFGFMPHDTFGHDFNGGYGLEDQRAALRWVKENIADFGGDPANVTIMGESAGAYGVCAHLLAPERTSGLFHKAIIQSGGCAYKLRHVTEGIEQVGKQVGSSVGCTGDDALRCLRQKPVKDLLDAGQQISNVDLMGFAPTYGTRALPLQSDEALATGQFVKVPMINGGNRDELRLYVAYDLISGDMTTRDNFAKKIKQTYGAEHVDAVLKKYPLPSNLSAASWLGTLWTDFHPDYGLNICVFLRAAQLASKHVKVYQYEFADRDAPSVLSKSLKDPEIQMGAVHTAELPYQFPGFSNTMSRDLPPLEAPQRGLAKVMMAYWTSFARTGTPSAEGQPTWRPFVTEEDVLWLEPKKIHHFSVDTEHKCDFWRKLYPDILAPKYDNARR